MKNFSRVTIVWVLTILILAALALACGGTPAISELTVKTATLKVETQAPLEQVTSPKPTDTPEPQSKLGDVIERYGYSLSAVTVEDPTVPGMLYEPSVGYKLVAVEIIVGNVSGVILSVNPLYTTLLDDEGFTYRPELGGRDGQIVLVKLNPGEKAKGWVAFELPEKAIPASVKYTIGLFGSEVLQVGLH